MFSLSVATNLELHHYELHHAELLFDAIHTSRAFLRQFLDFVDVCSVVTLEDFIRRSREKFVRGSGCDFGIWVGDELVGNVGLFDINQIHRKAEIGYWIAERFTRRGIMTQVVTKMLDYALVELGLNRVQLCCATNNKASARIAEKLGFTLEGVAREDRVLRGQRLSHQIWSILAKDWQGRGTAYFSRKIDDNLEMRLLETRHAAQVFALVDSNRDHLRQFLPWVDNNTQLEHSQQFILSCLEQFQSFDGINAGIWQHNQLAGLIGMHYIDWQHRDTEFGYWLGQEFTHQGIITKAAKALLEYLFLELNLERVGIAHATENTASRKVIERLGFKPESLTRDAEWLYTRFHDWQRYGLLRRDWMTSS